MTLKEKFEDIEDLGRYSENGYSAWSTEVLDAQSTKCVKIADEYAIEFAEWCGVPIVDANVKELLEMFKKEKGL